MHPTDQVLDMFVSTADTLVKSYDVVDFLGGLVNNAITITGTAAAGILLRDEEGYLECAAASTQGAERLEVFQSQRDQGPCVDACRTGGPMVNLRLSARDARARWPEFVPKAVAQGYESVHALPLRLRDDRIGALGLFGTDRANWSVRDVHVVQALADIATIGILQQRRIEEKVEVAAQLKHALTSRIIIEQAKGVYAERSGISVEEAFVILRSFARHHRIRLTDVCDRLLNDSAEFEELAQYARALSEMKPSIGAVPSRLRSE